MHETLKNSLTASQIGFTVLLESLDILLIETDRQPMACSIAQREGYDTRRIKTGDLAFWNPAPAFEWALRNAAGPVWIRSDGTIL